VDEAGIYNTACLSTKARPSFKPTNRYRVAEVARRAHAEAKIDALVSPLLAFVTTGDLPGHRAVFISWKLRWKTARCASAARRDQKVKWIPAWGEERISNMIATRPTGCISRQRVWGCAHRRVFSAKAAQTAGARNSQHGGWIFSLAKARTPGTRKKPKTFCLPGRSAPPAQLRAFRKEMDIIDVWFESGSSHAAVLAMSLIFPGLPTFP